MQISIEWTSAMQIQKEFAFRILLAELSVIY